MRNKSSLIISVIFLVGLLLALNLRLQELDSKAAEQRFHLKGLMLKVIKMSEKGCCVSADSTGKIDWCNRRFVRVFGLQEGDNLDKLMDDSYTKELHVNAFAVAMEKHRSGHPTEFESRDCYAMDRKGNSIPVSVSAWTTDEGVVGFIEVERQYDPTSESIEKFFHNLREGYYDDDSQVESTTVQPETSPVSTEG